MLRLVYRIPWLILHMVIGLPLTLLTFNPIGRRIPTWSSYAGKRRLDETMTCWWSATLCRIFGLRRRVNRPFPRGAQLVILNHVSWLDIQLLHSFSPMGFVAKAEIEKWFIFGFLAKAGDTVFHHRGSHDSSSGVVAAMTKRLQEDKKVALFAEGGILPGRGVKRFHARLFAAAIETNAEVQPVMLRYMHDPNPEDPNTEDPVDGPVDLHHHDITFYPGESMFTNLARLLTQKPCIAEVQLLEPFRAGNMQRKEAALKTHSMVVEAYDDFSGVSIDGESPGGAGDQIGS